VRSWAQADYGPGLALWRMLADLGLTGLCIAEDDGGVGGSVSDLVVAFERLGYHCVPGPYLESIALLPDLVTPEVRSAIAAGEVIATASVGELVPLAVDVAASTHAFVIGPDSIGPATQEGSAIDSIDTARRLSRLAASGATSALDLARVSAALERATLACAAFLVGAGERMLDQAVAYAKVREQFGRPIGEYQAIKHALADVHIAVTFARPLVHGAALGAAGPLGARGVSAAKIAAGDAASRAARVALQVHGAVGYTAEYDLGLSILRTRALVGSWGTPAHHRAQVMRSLLAPEH
jgi:alkylation response protein AidB-like acyl-CoA dehydrogenase